MKSPSRWPVHLAPIDGEALSSWLRRLAGSYEMTVGQLIEHGLGLDPNVERGLDRDPPDVLLDALEHRTGISHDRLREMCLAGWAPWLLDSLEADPAGFDPYVRQFSVLLKSGKRSKHSAGPWVAWTPREAVQRACPQCMQDPDRQGLLLIWQLPLSLSCPGHGVMLEPCIGFPGDYVGWTGDDAGPHAASEAVSAMDRRTEQALTAGCVELPGRAVHAGVWFRLLRTILDEVSTPAVYWTSRAADLRLIWTSCGLPVRAGKAVWRPYEAFPWPVQAQLLEAAAHAMRLLEDGTVRGRGIQAELFAPPVQEPVNDGRAQHRDASAEQWTLLQAAIEDAVEAARDDPADAQRLYNLFIYGCRTQQSVERLRSTFAELGIPTADLSHDPDLVPFA